MYYPYFRGKQFELLTVREMSQAMSSSGFVPIIEPVQESLNGLSRALDAVAAAKGLAIVIINPQHGSHVGNGSALSALFHEGKYLGQTVSPGMHLRPDTAKDEVKSFLEKYKKVPLSLIHFGFNDAAFLSQQIIANDVSVTNVFIDDYAGFLYRKHFPTDTRVLIKDGFSLQKRNADYPDVELFSDLHLTFQEYNAKAFGDFLMVGDNFSEGGGPAYAVAIHLTFIDSNKDNAMFVRHFVSDTRDSPTDTAGKFAEALEMLVAAVTDDDSQIERTGAVEEFLDLHKREHFPGLGYVKKLSMNHHIETLAQHLGNN